MGEEMDIEAFQLGAACEEKEEGPRGFLDDLKCQLDEEMTHDDVAQMLYLMKTGANLEFPDLYDQRSSIWKPSEILAYLENNMLEAEVMSFMKHVLSAMQLHPETSQISFAEMIQKFEWQRCQFGISEFVGRKEEVKEICLSLQSPEYKGVWVTGPGGIGKTFCAKEVCARMSNQSATRVYTVDLTKERTKADMFRAILRTLHVNPAIDDDTLQPTLFARLQALSDESLILLDNIENLFETQKMNVKRFFNRVFCLRTDKVKWLVTSRLDYIDHMTQSRDVTGQMFCFDVKPLQEKDARILLQRFCRPTILTEAKMSWLLHISDRVPLAIKLLSRAISHHLPGEHLNGDVIGHVLREGTSSIVEYAFERLLPNDRRNLIRLSVLQTTGFDLACAVDVLDLSECEARFTLLRLTHRQILQRSIPEEWYDGMGNNGDSYSFHSLVLQYLVHTYRDHLHLVNDARACLCRHILHKVGPYLEQQDSSFSAVHDIALKNNALFETVFDVLFDTAEFGLDGLSISLTELQYIQKVNAIIVRSSVKKANRYEKLAQKYQHISDSNLYLFCQKERASNLIADKNAVEALSVVTLALDSGHMAQCTEDQRTERTMGLLYEKARALRDQCVSTDAHSDGPRLQEAMGCLDEAILCCNQINTPKTTALTMEYAAILNAKGNVFFNQDNLDAATMCHYEAWTTAAQCSPNEFHPYKNVYEFNLGTIYHVKAEGLSTMDASRAKLYEDALEIFNSCIDQDRIAMPDKTMTLADKLSVRSRTYLRLGQYKNAMTDREEQLEILERIHDDKPHTAKTDAYIWKTEILIAWRKQFKLGTDESRDCLRKAVACCQDAEESIKDGHNPHTTGLKKLFLRIYRQLSGNLSKDRKSDVLDFCQRYEDCKPFHDDSSSSSGTESDSSSGESATSSTGESDISGYYSDPWSDSGGGAVASSETLNGHLEHAIQVALDNASVTPDEQSENLERNYRDRDKVPEEEADMEYETDVTGMRDSGIDVDPGSGLETNINTGIDRGSDNNNRVPGNDRRTMTTFGSDIQINHEVPGRGNVEVPGRGSAGVPGRGNDEVPGRGNDEVTGRGNVEVGRDRDNNVTMDETREANDHSGVIKQYSDQSYEAIMCKNIQLTLDLQSRQCKQEGGYHGGGKQSVKRKRSPDNSDSD